jgi:hypothetical protein
MVEAVVFAIVFVGFFALRFVAATLFFFYILPEGTRCTCCDAETLHIESRFWQVMAPRFRNSWCPRCNWHGLLKRTPQPPAKTVTQSGQLPLSSKKSSK